MEIRIGKNPEFTFLACINARWWYGSIALPFGLSWWYCADSEVGKNYEITMTFLCFHFSLEVWFCKEKK